MAWISTDRRVWLKFASLGIAAFALTFVLTMAWMPMLHLVTGNSNLGFDRQPAWLKAAYRLFTFTPWLALGFLLARSLPRRELTRPIAFATGTALAGAHSDGGRPASAPPPEWLDARRGRDAASPRTSAVSCLRIKKELEMPAQSG